MIKTDKFNVTPTMYTKLFNELTNIYEELEKLKERIRIVQSETEQLYITEKL